MVCGVPRKTGSALVQRMQRGPNRQERHRLVLVLPSTNCGERSKVRWRVEAKRADTQLVVHTFDEEENLVFLDSELVICVWLGFVVVDRLEYGKVGFWILGHVEARCQVEVTVAI